jgi:alginate O-acetyltransferase complex protein AlgI
MQFISLEFWLFFAGVWLACAWAARSGFALKKRVLVLASWLFYAWWNPPYILLLLATTSVDFWVGQKVAAAASPRRRRAWLLVTLCSNLGLLAYFKYAGFLLRNYSILAHALGWPFQPRPEALSIILPLGISFYTFHTMGYVIDVYRGKSQPCRDPWDFALYVSFFPQLVAGPIMRWGEFGPQLAREAAAQDKPSWQRAAYLVSAGLFKKLVLADSLARYADLIFAHPGWYWGPVTLLAVYAYALQIYFDFSGYTDIAEGLANSLGFRLMPNFDLPYLATSPRDFWRRWHMSLSRWLRDYLYISLGGSRQGWLAMALALMATMLLGGLWHGAAWTFVLWGGYHGALLVLNSIWSRWRGPAPAPGAGSRAARALKVLLTFHAVCLGWVLFRCKDLAGALALLRSFAAPAPFDLEIPWAVVLLVLAGFFFHAWEGRLNKAWREGQRSELSGLGLAAMHALTLVAILARLHREAPFIYFQF